MTDTADKAGDAVLGTLLAFYKPTLVTMVQAKGVLASDFFRDRQRVVYRAILALHAEGAHVDVLTVKAFLERHEMLERAGGEAFLELCTCVASAAGFKDHAVIVARSGTKDRLTRSIAALALANEREADDETLRELYAQVGRDIPAEHPSLRVVEGGRAA